MLYFLSHSACNTGLISRDPQALFREDECSQLPSSPPCCAEQGPWKAKLSRTRPCSSLRGFNTWHIILIFSLKKNLISNRLFPWGFGKGKPQTITETCWLKIYPFRVISAKTHSEFLITPEGPSDHCWNQSLLLQKHKPHQWNHGGSRNSQAWTRSWAAQLLETLQTAPTSGYNIQRRAQQRGFVNTLHQHGAAKLNLKRLQGLNKSLPTLPTASTQLAWPQTNPALWVPARWRKELQHRSQSSHTMIYLITEALG